LFLGYLPAFVLEFILIIQARELAGVEYYTLLPVRAILLLSIVVNAPVSIITGMLFPIACRWVGLPLSNKPQDGSPVQQQGLPVSRVYIIEAAGSFAGGLGATVLLGFGVSSARIFFILAFIVSLSALCVQLAKTIPHQLNTSQGAANPVRNKVFRRWTIGAGWALVPICVLVFLVAGVDKHLSQQVSVLKWTKLLPKDALIGSFRTAQAEYLYGIYRNQWLAMREGSVCETLPDEANTGRIAAIGLAQNPDAKRVLVIGSGLGLCHRFLRLPQIEHVMWAHCDSEYIQKVDKFIPPEFNPVRPAGGVSDKRFYRLAGDVRSLLAKKRVPALRGSKQYYDLVILNLPEATSSILNRYYTLEFYRQVKEALRNDGVLAVRVTGGENLMGTELVNLGASTKLTLQKVFSQLVLTPGEETWFIASDSENLTGAPGALRDRFAKIEGAERVFPPHALLSVYLPDRAAAAMRAYSGADLPKSLLINRDSRPLTHLYSLLLAAKQSGAPVTKFIKYLALAGALAFLIPILVFVVLRSIYVFKTTQQGSPSSFDSTFLVFSAGLVGIGAVIVLMYLYQTRFGSLYLHIGIISSLFMVGASAGAILISWLANRHLGQVTSYIFAVILVHILILTTIALWPAEQWTHLAFAIVFVLCGLCTGCYFPMAARQLADSGFETGQAGSKLETADHLGASAGGMLTGLALVPVLGAKVTVIVFVLLVLANAPFALLRAYKPEKICSLPLLKSEATAFRLRKFGYILFAVGVSVVLCSNLLAVAGTGLRPSLPQHAAGALAGESHLEQASTILPDSSRKVNYFKVYDESKKLIGYIFSSEDLAPEVRGFGGKMNLAIYVDAAGKLIDFHIIRSNETPAYLESLTQWRGLLNGHQLFGPGPFADVHAVTGATVSSKAILSALEKSGYRFATQILGQPVTRDSSLLARATSNDYMPDTHGIYLIGVFALALIVIYRGGFTSRLAVLIFSFVAGGIILNAQYSSEQIATLLSGHNPAVGLSGAFLLTIGVPLLIILFGNIYCGYVCPFGAAQELLGYIVPDRFKKPISVEKMRKARFVKYAVLFVLIIMFFLSRNRTTLSADPLVEIFHFRSFASLEGSFSIFDFQASMLLIAVVALVGSVFYTRFWCRYLCPVGAFLSLLNKLGILARYLPAKRFGRCEFGLAAKDQMDCLYCDRCRYAAPIAPPVTAPIRHERAATGTALSRYFVVGVVVVAIFVSAISVSRFLQVIPAGFGEPAVSVSAGGQPRDVDAHRIRTMIQQKRLSNKEAEFYKKVE
jgi:predicted membrane-bound spermidine synthase/Na+-translocating ferredoxin:NAD+ oxidoreductase RnfG subunit